MTIGRALRAARENAGISLRELARRINVDPAFLSRVEEDAPRNRPSPKVLDGYAEYTNANRDALYELAGCIPEDLASALRQPGSLERARAAMNERLVCAARPAKRARSSQLLASVEADASQAEQDIELLSAITEHEDARDEEREAFVDMLDQLTSDRVAKLTAKQRDWARRVATRIGAAAEDSENLFSGLSPERQREEQARAASVSLPWERDGYVRPLKPPSR